MLQYPSYFAYQLPSLARANLQAFLNVTGRFASGLLSRCAPRRPLQARYLFWPDRRIFRLLLRPVALSLASVRP